MNELVKELQKDNFPVLFRYKDICKLDFKRQVLDELFKESIRKYYIDHIYGDIYTLERTYRRTLVSECVLAQMIEPYSYASTYYVLSDQSWIPEMVYNVTSITSKTNMNISCGKYGCIFYKNIYENINLAGVYKEEDDNGEYLRAKPLRALCDLLCKRKEALTSLDSLNNIFRIKYETMEELTKEDFDELQGNIGVNYIETFLESIRKELQVD